MFVPIYENTLRHIPDCNLKTLIQFVEVKRLSLCPRHEGIQGEWKYSSIYS